MVDPGAESPRETWLRLLIIRAGLPWPQSQIAVRNEYGVVIAEVDMGWEALKIAAEYEGDHHRTDRRVFNRDIHRMDALIEIGWIVIRVTVEDIAQHHPPDLGRPSPATVTARRPDGRNPAVGVTPARGRGPRRLRRRQLHARQRDGVVALRRGDDARKPSPSFQTLACSVSPGNTTPANRAP